jgi:flagellin
MVALQTLKTINKNLGMTQAEISTGKRIANAKDNAAIWGISTTMQTDVSGFKAISESLSLGNATLTVGRDAAETVTSLLDQLKGRVVAAQEENVDRTKIQADVVALRDQITSVVSASQFNGLNLVQGTEEVRILASLDRSPTGEVKANSIGFLKQDLTTTAHVFGATASATVAGNITTATPITAASQTDVLTVSAAATGAGVVNLNIGGVDLSVAVANGATVTDIAAGIVGAVNGNDQLKELKVTATNTAGAVTFASANSFDAVAVGLATTTAAGVTFGADNVATSIQQRAREVTFASAPVAAGDSYRLTLGAIVHEYVAGANESMTDVVKGLELSINGSAAEQSRSVSAQAVITASSFKLLVDNGSGADIVASDTGTAGGTAAGGLRGLEALDVTTQEGARAALATIEGLIQTSIGAASAFGSAQGRMQSQTEYVSKIMDGLTSGIGALIDADMEAASAKLQALQVQQQLGIQALSIANQSPQSILSLFR